MPACFSDMIGFYEWEGLPCRILADPDRPARLIAEIYIPGKGFQPSSFGEIQAAGERIPETRFKSLVLGLTGVNP